MTFFNNPMFAKAASSLAGAFAPPSGSDAASWAAANAKREEAARLQWLFDNFGDPSASQRSALTGVQTYGATPEGFRYNVDQGNATQRYGYDTQAATARRGQDVSAATSLQEREMMEQGLMERLGITDATERYDIDQRTSAQRYGYDTQAATSRANNMVDNQRAAIGSLFGPLNPGQVRPDVPADLMGALGLPEVSAVAGALKPMSETEVRGDFMQTLLSPEEQRAVAFGSTPLENIVTPEGPRAVTRPEAVGQEPFFNRGAEAAAKLTNYQTPDGRTGSALFDPSSQTLVDAATRQPLPEGTRTFSGSLQGSSEDIGLTTSTRGRVEGSEIAAQKFQNLLELTRDLSNDPTNFGIPGFVKGTLQDVAAMTNGVSNALGFSSAEEALQSAQVEMMRSGIDPNLLPGVFDPNLAALQTTSDLLVYQAAAALAGQSGRDVSDRDVQMFKGVVGDPRAWTATPERFQAKLDQMERILNSMRTVDQDALNGGVGGRPVPAAPAAPEAPATTRLRFDENGNPL